VVETKQQDSKENRASHASHGVGALLRASRSRLGEDLRHVAQSLRIRLVYLEAIEESRFADLPGSTYAVGFVRAYSEYLGLDGDEVVRRFKEEYAEAEKRPELVFPVPVPERSLPTGAILLLSALLALGAYGGWYVIAGDEQDAELVPTLPQRLQSLLPGDNKSAEKTEDETIAEPVMEKAEEAAHTAIQEAEEVAEDTLEEAKEVVEETEKAVEGAVQEAAEEAAEDAVERVEQASEAIEAVEEKVEEVAEEVATATAPQPEAEQEQPRSAEKQPGQITEEPEETEITVEQSGQTTEESQEPANDTGDEEKAVEQSSETAQPTVTESGNGASAEAANEPESEEATAPVADQGASRIEVRATQPSWIQVRDEVANSMLVTRLLRPGDAYHVPNRKGLTLLTGNAGALEILVDGEKAPTIGELGAIRRKVILEAEKLMDGTAASE